MSGSFRASIGIVTALALVGTGACGRVDAQGPATALTPLVARERQCAPLISGSWPIELGAEALSAPAIDALVGAGLIQRETTRADPLARPDTRIVITPAGEEWIELRRLNETGNQTPVLCYGRRALVDAKADGDNATYRFRVVSPAPWVRRADIRAAFPFLQTALAGPLTSERLATLKDGRWQLPDHSEWSPGIPIERKGFYPCRPDDQEKPCG